MKRYQNKDNLILPLRIIPVLENNENLVLCNSCKGRGKLVVSFPTTPIHKQSVKCWECDGVGAVEATWTEKIVHQIKEGY